VGAQAEVPGDWISKRDKRTPQPERSDLDDILARWHSLPPLPERAGVRRPNGVLELTPCCWASFVGPTYGLWANRGIGPCAIGGL